MNKKPLDIDSGDVSLTLKRSSWENLFLVLSGARLVYEDETEEHWTIGNFWESIRRLESQFK